ncbi:MAG: hypothetical protein DMG43_05015 [Acidobacteria bacterium]|nr:MAG: hypothetical protein DMG43_05015 [Acidobacteriota bacterium]
MQAPISVCALCFRGPAPLDRIFLFSRAIVRKRNSAARRERISQLQSRRENPAALSQNHLLGVNLVGGKK